MLTAATTEVVRLASRVARRLDAGLVASAARNAQTGVLAAQLRQLDEMRTLSEFHALPRLTAQPDAAGAGVALERRRALVQAAG